ncbi:hypothetical protein MBM_08325 [Drepanopeziza brunnea f. sp. 'multigermtubi' MB_m1]|uniref:Uncharacterized protein n=1 Tax=Marssonina brunnea f. sp. multigermtubi (strain MB_m1) TaxID=1072389 RepID=K1WMQ6_MARBU|nr:uncharacterized protein MBM_08325 [Drepanopeziza brunnea f. sp. 'multigermtubi' MB_m1]EKD13607.1 hypothetical protein MBM_08325 [Drepanopeziza brunnea f. sp. 'multigermtubi' MB_m1]
MGRVGRARSVHVDLVGEDCRAEQDKESVRGRGKSFQEVPGAIPELVHLSPYSPATVLARWVSHGDLIHTLEGVKAEADFGAVGSLHDIPDNNQVGAQVAQHQVSYAKRTLWAAMRSATNTSSS